MQCGCCRGRGFLARISQGLTALRMLAAPGAGFVGFQHDHRDRNVYCVTSSKS